MNWTEFLQHINHNGPIDRDIMLWIEAIKLAVNPKLDFPDTFHLAIYIRSLSCIYGPDIYQQIIDAHNNITV